MPEEKLSKLKQEDNPIRKYRAKLMKTLCARAQEGDAIAQCELGWGYERGWWGKVNLEEAEKWYVLATKQRDLVARFNLFNLGHYYESGWGVEKNLTKAVCLYEIAASYGHPRAKLAITDLVKKGSAEAKTALKRLEQSAKFSAAFFQNTLPPLLEDDESLKSMSACCKN